MSEESHAEVDFKQLFPFLLNVQIGRQHPPVFVVIMELVDFLVHIP
jgi:hypothetical protein